MRLLPIFFLIGCASELTPLQKEIVRDYQLWIEEDVAEVQWELDGFAWWKHDISPIVEQSWQSEYKSREFRKDETIAKSRPATGHVYIDPETWYWIWIEEDYRYYKEAAEDCGDRGDGVMFAHKTAYAAYVLCHENAHNIHIRPHEDVYLLGEMCKEVRTRTAKDWLRECEE